MTSPDTESLPPGRLEALTLLVSALSILCMSCAPSPPSVFEGIAPSGPVDVVIDTDLTNEIDDEFALVYALLSPERLNVLAIHAAPYAVSPEIVEAGALSKLATRLLEEDAAAVGLDLRNMPIREPGPSMEAAFARAEEISALMHCWGYTRIRGDLYNLGHEIGVDRSFKLRFLHDR